jgi:predicted nicotinamide N-methyase
MRARQQVAASDRRTIAEGAGTALERRWSEPAWMMGGVIQAEFIRSATRLTPVPLVPELSLYLASDIYSLWEQTESALGQNELPPPFWSVAWPGGQALARYLLDHRELVAGRTVVDYGSGSGLVALAAVKAGAAAVTAVEPDPLGRAAIALNAAANSLAVPICVGAVPAAGQAPDLIFAADVWYDQQLAELVTADLGNAARNGASVHIADIGDTGRKYFPRDGYRRLATYELPSTIAIEGRERVSASVWYRQAS